MTRPTVTAIIPTYNRRQYIARAVASIQAQEPAPDEIIVVDDGSTDGTSEFLQERFGDSIKVLRQQNTGVSGARRLGVLEARGDWIAFLDSDDEWPAGRQEALIRAVERAPDDVPWVFGNTVVISDGGSTADLFKTQGFAVKSDLQVYEDALETQFPFQFSLLSSSLIRREALLETKAFAEGLRSSEDFLASFRVALKSRFAAIPDTVSVVYRTSDLKTSSLDHQERRSPDYFMARVLAFDEAARAAAAPPHGRSIESVVRGYCIARSEAGAPARMMALRQFRHGVSIKGVAFAAVAMLGPRGVGAWRSLSRTMRGRAGRQTILEYAGQLESAV